VTTTDRPADTSSELLPRRPRRPRPGQPISAATSERVRSAWAGLTPQTFDLRGDPSATTNRRSRMYDIVTPRRTAPPNTPPDDLKFVNAWAAAGPTRHVKMPAITALRTLAWLLLEWLPYVLLEPPATPRHAGNMPHRLRAVVAYLALSLMLVPVVAFKDTIRYGTGLSSTPPPPIDWAHAVVACWPWYVTVLVGFLVYRQLRQRVKTHCI
jgi:hypothetical protein